MAGILYLYRLLIYHRERGVVNKDIHELLRIMEVRLYRYITLPAMLISAAAGLWMIILQPDLLQGRWLGMKLMFVVCLMVSTLYAGGLVRRASSQPQTLPTSRYLRFANEVPTLLMLVIVGLVVFKAI
jgi:putative membrane protein